MHERTDTKFSFFVAAVNDDGEYVPIGPVPETTIPECEVSDAKTFKLEGEYTIWGKGQ